MQVVGNRLLIQFEELEEKVSDGGIIMKETTKSDVLKAQIKSVGSEADKQLKAGQLVLVPPSRGVPVFDGDIKYHVIEYTDVLVIL